MVRSFRQGQGFLWIVLLGIRYGYAQDVPVQLRIYDVGHEIGLVHADLLGLEVQEGPIVGHGEDHWNVDEPAEAALLVDIGDVAVRTVDVRIACEGDYDVHDRAAVPHEVSAEQLLGPSWLPHDVEGAGDRNGLHPHGLETLDEVVYGLGVPIDQLRVGEDKPDGYPVRIQRTEMVLRLEALLPVQIEGMKRMRDRRARFPVSIAEMPCQPPYEEEVVLGRLVEIVSFHVLELGLRAGEQVRGHHIHVQAARDRSHERFRPSEDFRIAVKPLELPRIPHAPDVHYIRSHGAIAQLRVDAGVGLAFLFGVPLVIYPDPELLLDFGARFSELLRRRDHHGEECQLDGLPFGHVTTLSCVKPVLKLKNVFNSR